MPQSLASKIRAKFPGQYDDLDDQTLERKVLAAHPEYKDLVAPSPMTGDAAAAAAQARAETESRGLRRMGQGALSTLNPKTIGAGLLEAGSTIRDAFQPSPEGAQRMLQRGRGLLDMGKRAVTGQFTPEESGALASQVAQMYLAPKVPGAVRSGVGMLNTAATGVAESPLAQRAIGGTMGAVTGATGGISAGGPIGGVGGALTGWEVGARFGQTGVKTAAELLQKMTGGARVPSGASAAGLSAADVALIKKLFPGANLDRFGPADIAPPPPSAPLPSPPPQRPPGLSAPAASARQLSPSELAGQAELDAIQTQMHGGPAPTVGNGTFRGAPPDPNSLHRAALDKLLSGPDMIQGMREQMGSVPAGKALYPAASPKEAAAAVVRQTAEGPYALPQSVRDTMDTAISGMQSPAEIAAYAAKAASQQARQYILSKLKPPSVPSE